ncbi:MAG: DUF3795 domain-containing protein [Desulfopila sp.]
MKGYCGLNCDACAVYLATVHADVAERAAVAAVWSVRYGWALAASDIECQGCLQDEVLFGFCADCEVRQCAVTRHVDSCAGCQGTRCTKIARLSTLEPEVCRMLEKLQGGEGFPTR